MNKTVNGIVLAVLLIGLSGWTSLAGCASSWAGVVWAC